jgi:hypothetical protein
MQASGIDTRKQIIMQALHVKNAGLTGSIEI